MDPSRFNLIDIQRDRAIGALVGAAAGDALGAGYEFRGLVPPNHPVAMIGGGRGPFRPGEWTDDTAMAIAIAESLAARADLRFQKSLDAIFRRWQWWARNAQDVDPQTWEVLRAPSQSGATSSAAATLHHTADRLPSSSPVTRAAPLALGYLDDEPGLVAAARAIVGLTHPDPDSADACVLWSAAIRHAVLTGQLDVRIGLPHIDSERQDLWRSRIEEAEKVQPSAFADTNSRVVPALQCAWSAIAATPVPTEDPAAEVFRADHLRLALETAVRAGGDTDTVASAAGALLGALYGMSAVPWHWRLALKGWPGLNTHCLAHLATKIVDPEVISWFDYSHGAWREHPRPVRHPRDDFVWIGVVASLRNLPKGVDAVVSLCPVADGFIPCGVTHLDVRLASERAANANLDFVLLDTVRAIEGLRAEGHEVFIHDSTVHNRAPAVATLYGSRRRDIDIFEALQDIRAVIPDANPNPEFWLALRRLRPHRDTFVRREK
ncbi:MAG: ADP-ribosylglycohydrolase family protein [Mycobacterium sp.]